MKDKISSFIGIVVISECSLEYKCKRRVEDAIRELGMLPHVWYTQWLYDGQCFVLLYYTNEKSEALMKLKYGNNLDEIVQGKLDGK